jgi:hypothetical protein
MDIQQAKQDIQQWIQDFVEVPNAALSGWPPCPYARQARINNLVDIRAGGADPYVDLMTMTDLSGHDVVILVYDPQEFSPDEFNDLVNSANLAFLQGRNLIALADHPQDREEVNGVCMNQGRWALVFVQSRSRLDSHAHALAQKGFYRGWPEDYLNTVFQGREDPRT